MLGLPEAWSLALWLGRFSLEMNNEQKYYYVYYREVTRVPMPEGFMVIDEHPLDWRRKNEEFVIDVLFFAEVSKEVYERNEGYF